jgi:hypothetical protein
MMHWKLDVLHQVYFLLKVSVTEGWLVIQAFGGETGEKPMSKT